MKKQYKKSFLDSELSNLDADIVWKNAQSDELKNKLVRDINKLSVRTKYNKLLSYSVRTCAVTVIVVIAFILVKQDDTNNISSSSLGSYHNEIYPFDVQVENNDVSVVFSKKDQELLKMVNGVKTLVLTQEATIPLYVNETIPSIKGEPEIAATKDNNSVLVRVTYPLKGDNVLSIRTAINKKGSAKLEYDSLVKKYFDMERELTISNQQAILLKPDEDKVQQLIVVSEEFVYYISGEQSSDVLIKMASLINFNK